MSDELEDLLDRLTPHGPTNSLRERVVSSVAKELSGAARPKNRHRLGWAIVVGILLTVALNIWVGKRQDNELTGLYGSPPPSPAIEELSRVIESATDVETAQWFKKQMNSARRKRNPDNLRREQQAVEASATH